MEYKNLVVELKNLIDTKKLHSIYLRHDVIVNKDFELIIRARKNPEKPHYAFASEYPIIYSLPIEKFILTVTEQAADTVLALNNEDYVAVVADRYKVKLIPADMARNLKGDIKKEVEKEMYLEEQERREDFLKNPAHQLEVANERLRLIKQYEEEIVKQVEKVRDSTLEMLIVDSSVKNRYKKALFSFGVKDAELWKYGME